MTLIETQKSFLEIIHWSKQEKHTESNSNHTSIFHCNNIKIHCTKKKQWKCIFSVRSQRRAEKNAARIVLRFAFYFFFLFNVFFFLSTCRTVCIWRMLMKEVHSPTGRKRSHNHKMALFNNADWQAHNVTNASFDVV